MLSIVMLSVAIECRYAECRYAECRYAKCCYAECRGATKSANYAKKVLKILCLAGVSSF